MNDKQRQRVEDAYERAHLEAIGALEAIRGMLHDLPAPGDDENPIDWGHVGTANEVKSRLWDIAAALDVSISFFFEGLDANADDKVHKATAADQLKGDLLADKEALELVRSYYAIPEPQRRRLFDLARVLSESAA